MSKLCAFPAPFEYMWHLIEAKILLMGLILVLMGLLWVNIGIIMGLILIILIIKDNSDV